MTLKPKVFRPHLDDVERLSHGKGAKKQRGTGSKYVCHRLNQDERKLFDLAKKKSCASGPFSSFLTLRGTGYRKERKGSPLCNIWRQRCDALEELCVIVEKRSGSGIDGDRLVIDFSTLRVRNDAMFVSMILENVLKAKYPDLYDLVMKQADGADNGSASTLIRTPINWETVKTEPIWAVNERLVIVPCDRDVAKCLATDVLKESSKFVFDDIAYKEIIIEEEKALTRHDDEAVMTMSTSTIISAADVYGDDDDSCIDWDDI
mmetsp:Transcript_26261/g.45682  ORF Transcript_26261/g.45682 Transcript_26261/m.45682 type:complete len:262 (-) Transcript_26261:27-812(-)